MSYSVCSALQRAPRCVLRCCGAFCPATCSAVCYAVCSAVLWCAYGVLCYVLCDVISLCVGLRPQPRTKRRGEPTPVNRRGLKPPSARLDQVFILRRCVEPAGGNTQRARVINTKYMAVSLGSSRNVFPADTSCSCRFAVLQSLLANHGTMEVLLLLGALLPLYSLYQSHSCKRVTLIFGVRESVSFYQYILYLWSELS